MRLLLKNLVFTVVVPGTAGVYAPLRIAGPWHRPSVDLSSITGLALLLIGGAGYFWCLWEFMMTGRGTPLPLDPPIHLVARGPYRFVRNPMYLSALLAVLGWALYLGSGALVLYAGALWAGFHLFVIYVEEPSLRRRFGESYTRYCRVVQRWRPGRAVP